LSVYIIAEAGVNHNGQFELAKKMIEVAKVSGVDAIKFQTFCAHKLVIAKSPKAEYQEKSTGKDESQLEMLKKLELSKNEFIELKHYCDKLGIEFLSSPFDLESLEFLHSIGLKYWKIPSGEITNLPYLIEIPIAAVAMGANIIEKHFTLDRNMVGPDHKASLEPDELKAMIDAIRNVETALGDGIKKPAESEKKNIHIVRKSIVAEKKITRGELLTEENLTVKRPADGVSPMKWFEVLGKKAPKDFEEDEQIEV